MKKVLFLIMLIMFLVSCLNFQPKLSTQAEQKAIHEMINKKKEEVFKSLIACSQGYNYFQKLKEIPIKLKEKTFENIKINILDKDERKLFNDCYELIKPRKMYKLKDQYSLDYYNKTIQYKDIEKMFECRKKISDILYRAGYLRSKYDILKDHPLLEKYRAPIFFLSNPDKNKKHIKKEENYGLIYIPNEDNINKENKIIIAFRGSITSRDWLLDFYFPNSGQFAMNYLYNKIDENIFEEIIQKYPDDPDFEKEKYFKLKNDDNNENNRYYKLETRNKKDLKVNQSNQKYQDPIIINRIFNKLISISDKQGNNSNELFQNVLVENGFFITYNFFSDSLNDILNTIKINAKAKDNNRVIKDVNGDEVDVRDFLNENTQIYITGHSLGSSSAYLFALDYIHNNPDFYENKADKLNNINVITFAAPRVGNHEFVELFSEKVKNSIRIANCLDSITQLPMSNTFGYLYEHVNYEYCLLFAPDRKYGLGIKIPSNKQNVKYTLNTMRLIKSKSNVHYLENYYQTLEHIFLNPNDITDDTLYLDCYSKYPELYRDNLIIIQPPISNNYLSNSIKKDLFEKKIASLNHDERAFIEQYYKYDSIKKEYKLRKIYIDHKIKDEVFKKIKEDLSGVFNREFILNKFEPDSSKKYYILKDTTLLKEKLPAHEFLRLFSYLNDEGKNAIKNYFVLDKKEKNYIVNCRTIITPELREKIFKILDLNDLNDLK